MDAGTNDSFLEAQLFIQSTEKRQGLKIGCLEEIAINNKWISKIDLMKSNNKNIKSEYQKYIKNLLKN